MGNQPTSATTTKPKKIHNQPANTHAYQRLVMCLDWSGSMSGTKISNAIKYLTKIAEEFDITTNYFTFTTSVTETKEYCSLTSWCGGGTRIQYCLNDLLTNHLRRFTDDKTKFIFVTDACDSIKKVQDVISNKISCENAYKNKLHSYCLLTGASGGCSNELEQIFGSKCFNHVTDNNFESILKQICGNIKIANKLHAINTNIESEINTVKQDTNHEIQAIMNKIDTITNVINTTKEKTTTAQNKINQTKQNLADLNRETANVTTQVQTAQTDTDIDAAEDAARALKSNYRKEDRRLKDANTLLNESEQAIRAETAKADAIAKKLHENGNKLSQKANGIIKNITSSLQQLSGITTGAYEQVKELKASFEKDLDELMSVVNANNKVQMQFENIQNDISDSFKKFKRGKVEFSQFKQDVQNKIEEVNRLLEILNER